MQPRTRYARSGNARIAYQVVGSGPFDFVFVPGFVSNLDVQWEHAGFRHLLTRFAAFSRLIIFDKRGTGLSDPVDLRDMPGLEARMDDVRAVMDAAGSTQAALFGGCEGGPMATLFAATYPERTRALVLYGAYARFDPSVLPPLADYVRRAQKFWGTGKSAESFAPSVAHEPAFRDWWGRFERLGASPAAAITLFRMNAAIDVRHVLGAIQAPTLVLHRRDDRRVKVAAGRELGSRIPAARYVELPGIDHLPWVGDIDRLVDEVEEFLTGVRPTCDAGRVLATIVVARVVDTAGQATRLGDRQWRIRLAQMQEAAAGSVAQYSGHPVSTGIAEVVARFDGPARAARCALAMVEQGRTLGLTLAAGVHTGEVQLHDATASGAAIHIAAQVAGLARPGEVLASRVVADLVPGSGLQFAERGSTGEEAGVPETGVLAVREGGDPPLPCAAAMAIDGLSGREQEVLALVARGLSNAAIGQHLTLSEFTVKRHVSNILRKLDLPNRAAAASLAAQSPRRDLMV